MKEILQIIPTGLLEEYCLSINSLQLTIKFNELKDAEISTGTFSFYTSVSAITSSRIEGEQMEIDSYIKMVMLFLTAKNI